METAGEHTKVERLEQKDINGRLMVVCRSCDTFAHAHTHKEAVDDLSTTSCAPNCANCKSLSNSNDRAPAVPLRGSCNDVLHVCPNDGNRWWQMNTHFHLWQRVTSDREWQSLRNPVRHHEEDGFGIGF